MHCAHTFSNVVDIYIIWNYLYAYTDCMSVRMWVVSGILTEEHVHSQPKQVPWHHHDLGKILLENHPFQVHRSESSWRNSRKGWVRGYDKQIHGSCAMYFPGGICQGRFFSCSRFSWTFRNSDVSIGGCFGDPPGAESSGNENELGKHQASAELFFGVGKYQPPPASS